MDPVGQPSDFGSLDYTAPGSKKMLVKHIAAGVPLLFASRILVVVAWLGFVTG